VIRVSILILLLVTGCATSPRQPTPQQQTLANIRAWRASINARWQQAQSLPYDQKVAMEEQLLREQEELGRSIDRLIQKYDRQQAIDAQNDLTDAINDLSTELRRSRGSY
jgi:hypothetical protein